jgi:hypothetical protein
MTATPNTSPILHNPSQRREGFEQECPQTKAGDGRVGENLTNPSWAAVKDLGGRKSINNRYISLSSINTSHPPAHDAAWCARTREGLCEGFLGRIRSASHVPWRSIARRSHTFAPCCVALPTSDEYAIVACDATRARVARRHASPPGVGTWWDSGKNRACGSSSRVRHSLFRLSGFFREEVLAMSESSSSSSSSSGEGRERSWHVFVVPTARGLERFGWRVAWFALLVKILFFS